MKQRSFVCELLFIGVLHCGCAIHRSAARGLRNRPRSLPAAFYFAPLRRGFFVACRLKIVRWASTPGGHHLPPDSDLRFIFYCCLVEEPVDRAENLAGYDVYHQSVVAVAHPDISVWRIDQPERPVVWQPVVPAPIRRRQILPIRPSAIIPAARLGVGLPATGWWTASMPTTGGRTALASVRRRWGFLCERHSSQQQADGDDARD